MGNINTTKNYDGQCKIIQKPQHVHMYMYVGTLCFHGNVETAGRNGPK